MADYCRLSGGRPLLAQGPDGYCIFWKKLCTIHPVKPRMCRRWPFIESILVDPANWLAMAGSCPGMATGIPLPADDAVVAYPFADPYYYWCLWDGGDAGAGFLQADAALKVAK